MSHQATNWAIKQRGIRPAAKIVLWHLCDRFHPDHGCFPSQETLAYDCEMSRASINRCLSELEAANLIRRHQRVDPKTKKQTSTEYTFAFQFSMSQNETRDTGAVSQNEAEPCLKMDESRVSKCDTNPVREPLIEPVKTRECAYDLFSANEKTEKEEDTFEIFWESYPHNPKRRDKKSARAKFWAIVQRRAKGLERYATGEELVAAAKAYAATNPDRNFVPGAEVWLNKSRWIGFLDGLDGEHFSEDDLTPSQVSMLSDGLVPPSMKVDGKPTPAARHWLKVYGHGVRA